MVKKRYEKIPKKGAGQRKLLLHTSSAKKCHDGQEGTSMGGVLGSEGRGKGRCEPLPFRGIVGYNELDASKRPDPS